MIILDVHNNSDININDKAVENLINLVLNKYGLSNGKINLIITSDKILREMKKNYFNQNYFTDVIAFNIEENPFEGEIYISHQRVKENAIKYKQNFQEELKRVIIHGVLHLCGKEDSTKKEKSEMTSLEDLFLKSFSKKLLD